MLALVKPAPGPGLELREVPMPGDRHQRRPHPGPADGDLRDGPPHRVVGPVGGPDDPSCRSSSATSSSARSSRSAATSTDFHPGDLVSGEGHVVCGRCRHCLAGRRHLCAHTIGLGVGRDGAFAEYVALPMTNIWHHWPGIDPEVAAIFDPFGNAVHTALAFPVLGEDVLVSGAGPIGLMATAVVRHAGARFIVVSEPNPFRRELALRMGATVAVDPRERDLADGRRGARDGRGLRRRPRDVGHRRGAPRARSRRWPTAAGWRSSASRPRRSRSTSTRSSSRC